MLTVYLNFPGTSAEAAVYYAEAFQARPAYVMRTADVPEADRAGMPPELQNGVMYAAIMTYAGELQFSDDVPGDDRPNSTMWISVTDADEKKIRHTFDFLAREGEVLSPLAPAFFTPLYGQVKDKYGFHWMFMLPSPMESGGTAV